MKIVILTGRFGMGHFSAAEAIREQLQSSDPEAEIKIIDWFEFISPYYADKFYKLYTLIANQGSGFYNRRYRFLENRRTNQRPELCQYFIRHFSKFIEKEYPDVIFSTLPTCSQIASLYMDQYGTRIPLITCVTDITGHSEWISRNTEFYLVGSQLVKEKFIQKGVAPEQIYETGIPVKKEFDFTPEKHSENSDRRKILLMGGGLGILPENPEFYEAFSRLMNTETVVITGRNHKLYERICGKYPSISVFGYVTNVYDYMRWADVIISKPGGVTIFEAIHSELPIIALNPYLQQEIYNAQYIEKMQIGKVANGTGGQLVNEIKEYLAEDKLDYFRRGIRQVKGRLKKDCLPILLNEAVNQEAGRTYESNGYPYRVAKDKEAVHEKVGFNL